MTTVVVQGGTDGMGRAAVLARLGRGDTVVAIGSAPEKGRRLAEEAAALGAGDRLRFIRADLSSIAENERVVAEVRERCPAVDALVLCANRQHPRRTVTADGLEATFALYYLSRYLLGHGLRAAFDAAPAPVVVNIAGAGLTAGAVRFDDLNLERGYGPIRAQLQAGRANDLLGRSMADAPSSRAHVLLYHPGFTRTAGGLAALPRPVRAVIAAAGRVAARSPQEAAAPVVAAVDDPPARSLTAVDRGRPVDLSLSTFDPAKARRLAEATRDLVLARYGPTPLLPEPLAPGAG
ncbi:SDR family NAD(P)-dependent oxidoreductase [Nocardiopsis suaedae]|uniref:SDR family NAD(P)-dependent oxidoreductase n=1 Tax=Nocardiopsis suaedae TaxID=3018444 RepID=A0ABT4TJC3_9ACTN|nr:SDR family NAD(P)-dependent oxidoreductase [Nocardiopsis suaedae]MDA2804805.1 SDR family NAD(P)-dependent oxidoreductase [Nocardiopsis suaedae]